MIQLTNTFLLGWNRQRMLKRFSFCLQLSCFLPADVFFGISSNLQEDLSWELKKQIVWNQLLLDTQIRLWVVVSNIFYVHPYLGKIPIFTTIFQMGWNHQLVWLDTQIRLFVWWQMSIQKSTSSNLVDFQQRIRTEKKQKWEVNYSPRIRGGPKIGIPQNGWFIMKHLIKIGNTVTHLY